MTARRYIHTTALWVACLLLAACSDQVLPEAETPMDYKGGPVYISLSLGALGGGDDATRATTYDDGGDADDYKVNDATLLLFRSTTATYPTESDMKFFGLYHLNSLATTPLSTDYVTQQYGQVVELPGVDPNTPNQRFFAYVIVNAAGWFDTMGPDAYDRATYRMRNILDKPYYTLTSETTFADFAKEIITNRGGPGNHVMTNAPQATKNGKSDWSDPKIVSIPEVKNFYASAEDASAATAVPVYVYVERLAVKITVNVDKASGKVDGKLLEPSTGTTVNYNKDNIRWVTAWRPTSGHNVRQIPNAATYIPYTASEHPSVTRFIAGTPMAANAKDPTDYYRVLWAEDPNYGVTGGLEPGPNVTLITENQDHMDFETGKPGFTWENTMTADDMIQDRTSRVIVRVQFDVPHASANNTAYVHGDASTLTHESFFTIQREGQDKIFYENEDTSIPAGDRNATNTYYDYVWNYLTNLDRYKAWKAALPAPLNTTPDDELVSLIITRGNGTSQTAYRKLIYNTTDPSDPDNWKKTTQATVTEVPAYGTVKLYFTPNMNNAAYDSKLSEAQQLDFLYLDLGAETDKLQAETNYYYRGFAYYSIKVRHFSDDEVNDFVHKKGEYDEIYPASTGGKTRAENYLGRYGMVRNNWYDMTIDGIKHIGYSVSPPYEGDIPDDIEEDYLGLRTHIATWSRRGQEEDL